MNIERIKSVELLVTLKGMAQDDSKQQIWHPGTIFRKPFPRNIVAELVLNRPGVLKVIEEEPPSEPDFKDSTLWIDPEKLETPDVPEKQKEDPAQPKTDKKPLEDTQDVPPKKRKRTLKKLTKAG